MRLALVISSNYSENNVVSMCESFEDTAKLVEARLSGADTEFTVFTLKANRDLPEQLDELLEEHRDDLEGLLIHFSGYLAVKPDRGLALLLDGSRLRAFPISRLRASLSQASVPALVIMDVDAVADGDVKLDQIAQGLGTALNEVSPHISVLSSVALSENSIAYRRGCKRLTDLWLLSVEYHAAHSSHTSVLADPVVRAMQSERLAYFGLASFDYRPGEHDFAVIPGSDGAGTGADEELPTIPPNFGKRPSLLDLPLPVPSPAGSSTVPGPPAGAAGASQAAYFPSAPPPIVQNPPVPVTSTREPGVPPPVPATANRELSVPPPSAVGSRAPASEPAPRPIADLHVVTKDPTVYEDVVVSIESVLVNDPRHVPSLRALSDAAQTQRDLDTAALASAVLICLKSGRPEDEVRLAKLVTDGLPLARRTLSDLDFEATLIANPDNVFLFRTLGRLTKVAVAAGLATNSRYEELPKDATVLDPESSTITLGRSLAWAAKFVGVSTPELVVLADLPTHMELTVNGADRLLISKQLGSGLSLAQLAFLGARHLSMLRPEFKWRSALDTPERLAAVIGHCARLLREGPDFFRSVGDAERKGAKRFVSQLEADPSLYERVTQAFGGLEVQQPLWDSIARSILVATDRVLLRNGLLACANPEAAWQLTQQYPLASLLSVDEQLDEIARFATSRDHLALRKSLGLTAMPN